MAAVEDRKRFERRSVLDLAGRGTVVTADPIAQFLADDDFVLAKWGIGADGTSELYDCLDDEAFRSALSELVARAEQAEKRGDVLAEALRPDGGIVVAGEWTWIPANVHQFLTALAAVEELQDREGNEADTSDGIDLSSSPVTPPGAVVEEQPPPQEGGAA